MFRGNPDHAGDRLNAFYFFDPPSSYRIPLADSWNLAVQHSFSSSLMAEIAYVGNVGRHLFMNPNVNQAALDPNCIADGTCNNFNARRRFDSFGLDQAIFQTCNCDNSDYHALQAKVQQRLAHGLDFLVSYTWGKAMADTETGGAFSNNLNWKQDRGPANYNRTQALTISHVWQLPYGRGRHWGSDLGRAMDLLLGGWNFTGITTVESGLPFTVTVSNAPNVYADLNSVRPDRIGNPSVPNPSANLWFNPAAFVAPQGIGRNGLVSHNSLRGPGFYEFDLGLGKTFTIAEGKSVEFKWENFNATNHVNLGNPNATVDQQGAGQITSAADMRQMQFGLHFRF